MKVSYALLPTPTNQKEDLAKENTEMKAHIPDIR